MSDSVSGAGKGQAAAGAAAAQRAQQQRQQAAKQGSIFAKVIQELMQMMRKYLGSIGLNDAGLKASQQIYQLLQGISTNLQILTAAKSWDISSKTPIPSNLATAAENLKNDLLKLKHYPALIKQIGADAHPPLSSAQIKTLTKAMGTFVSKFLTELQTLPSSTGLYLLNIYNGRYSHITVADIVQVLSGSFKYFTSAQIKEWNAAIAGMAQELSFLTDQSQIRTSEISFLMQQFQTLGQGANQVTSKQFKVLELMISLTSK